MNDTNLRYYKPNYKPKDSPGCWLFVGALLFLCLMTFLTSNSPPRSEKESALLEKRTAELQQVEAGDIIQLKDGSLLMVQSRLGSSINFGIPVCGSSPTVVGIRGIAPDVEMVIKFGSMPTFWSSAAYKLMTGRDPSLVKRNTGSF